MKIAVIGGGISGIYAAYKLSPAYEVTLYEADGYLGGHTDTHHVTVDNDVCSVDTGFIVFNKEHYPLFSSFIDELNVKSQPSDMSFSVSDRNADLEYNAGSLSGLFCQQRNLLRPGFYRMLLDLLRFYKQCPELLAADDNDLTIGSYLQARGYGQQFIDNHIIPMASALWSSPPSTVSRFPARYFVAFMHNHNMLQVANRPVWRTVAGGSCQYVNAFAQKFRGLIRVRSRVLQIDRTSGSPVVRTSSDRARYDAVIIACHSDQALAVLSDATDHERRSLSAINYQQNEITLHTDASVMPARAEAWASWNVVKPRDNDEDFIVTYYMNMLQSIETPTPLLVSLNADYCIDQNKVLLRRQYHHPVYTPESLHAQSELREISGMRNTYFAGAYMGWGFHEDGARSAQHAVDTLVARSITRAA